MDNVERGINIFNSQMAVAKHHWGKLLFALVVLSLLVLVVLLLVSEHLLLSAKPGDVLLMGGTQYKVDSVLAVSKTTEKGKGKFSLLPPGGFSGSQGFQPVKSKWGSYAGFRPVPGSWGSN